MCLTLGWTIRTYSLLSYIHSPEITIIYRSEYLFLAPMLLRCSPLHHNHKESKSYKCRKCICLPLRNKQLYENKPKWTAFTVFNGMIYNTKFIKLKAMWSKHLPQLAFRLSLLFKVYSKLKFFFYCTIYNISSTPFKI